MEKIISTLILKIKCSHTMESDVLVLEIKTEESGTRGLVVVKWRKSPLMEREVWGQVEPGCRWKEEAVVSSCFIISSWSTYNSLSRKLLTSLICKISKHTSPFCFVGGFSLMHSATCLNRRRRAAKSWSSRSHRWSQSRSEREINSTLPVWKLWAVVIYWQCVLSQNNKI